MKIKPIIPGQATSRPVVRIFQQDGWMAEVEVIEEWVSYKLRVRRTLRQSRFGQTPSDGTVFNVSRRKDGGSCSGMCRLSADPPPP
jgi:hypothetical protein